MGKYIVLICIAPCLMFSWWETLADMPSSSTGHSLATAGDGYHWAFGIHLSGVYNDTVYKYDIANDVWIDGTTNPYGGASYGTAHYVNGKFYRIGGTNSWPVALNRVDIYDATTDTWTSGFPAITGLLDHSSGVFQDRYIITFGNGNWSMSPTNEVYVYDTESDIWNYGSDFPGIARGCASFGIIDTFAVGAFGYTTTGHSDEYIVGIINENLPTQITWGPWTSAPGGQGYRVPYAADTCNNEVWFLGVGIPPTDIWSYNPYTDIWTQWSAPLGIATRAVSPLAVTFTSSGDIGVFIAAGEYSGQKHYVMHTNHYGVEEITTKADQFSGIGFSKKQPSPVSGYLPITYLTTKNGTVYVSVFDLTGQTVRTLVEREFEHAGYKTIYWNGKDDYQRTIPNGTYFLRLEAQGQTATEKIVYIK